MPHSYTHCLIHLVFSTKGRQELIAPGIRDRLHAYLGGIARENEMKALAVGGTGDHVHMLLSMPGPSSIARAAQFVKGGSSKWIHDTFPQLKAFAWQEGYGAFSIGVSAVDDTIAYINNQIEHHRVRTFEEEFTGFLNRHGIAYDERYVFG